MTTITPTTTTPQPVLAAYLSRFGRAANGDWWRDTDHDLYLHSPNGSRVDFHANADGAELPKHIREDLNSAFFAAHSTADTTTAPQLTSGPVSASSAPLRLTPYANWCLGIIAASALASAIMLGSVIGGYGPSYDRGCCALKIGVPADR